MFNILSIFDEFGEILDLFNKNDFPSKIEFHDPKTNNTLEILVIIHNSNKIIFNIKFYLNKKQINITKLNKSSIIFFHTQYIQYIKQLLPLEIKSYPNVPKRINIKPYNNKFLLFKLPSKMLNNKFKIEPLLLYSFTLLNIYSIDLTNNNPIARTIMKSFDKINIINNSYIDNTNILLEIHKLNVVLVDSIIQNRIKLFLKMFTHGTRFFIRFFRFYLSIFWLLFNIIFSLQANPQISTNNVLDMIFQAIFLYVPNITPLIIVNIIIPIILYLLPRIIRTIITIKLQKTNHIIQLNRFFSKFNNIK